MASIDENRANWGRRSAWRRGGEEWSQAWGSTRRMWLGSILPRLAPFLPAAHLLEIACGHGRVTAHLLEHCERYTGVDVVPGCVEACRARFARRAGACFEVTDGKSLPMLAPESVDFAFSWDSLVHADGDALGGYLDALGSVLRPGGAAFLHHSNLGAFAGQGGAPSIPNEHWRDPTVSAALARALAERAGLACISQELVQWGTRHCNDCFTVVWRAPAGAPHPPTEVREHPDMGAEMALFRHIESIYPLGGDAARGDA